MRALPSWRHALIAAASTSGCLLTTDFNGLAGQTAGEDAGSEAPVDGAPFLESGANDSAIDASRRCDPDSPFNPSAPLANVNTAANEGGPRLSPDELTMYFESERPGGVGKSDLYVATRASLGAPFAKPTLLENQNHAGNEYTATALPDGLTLAFASDRAGEFTIFLSKRTARGAPFGTPERAALDANGNEAHPAFTLGGDALYFTSDRPGGAGGFDLYRADFGAGGVATPARLGELAGPTDDITPVVAADELTIIFSRGTATGHNLWKARRASRSAPWQAPRPMTDMPSGGDTFSGWMSPDACRLYVYARVSAGNLDIFVADRSR